MPPLTRLLASGLAIAVLAGCGADAAPPRPPLGMALTAQEREVWSPLPVSDAGIPVLLYHGLGERTEFGDPADAAYAITRPDFAKQMALLRAGGYEAITLEQFRAFHAGEPVELPARPVLLTFDDALASSIDGADAVLRELGWTAVMFVDVGAVTGAAPGYAGWPTLAAAERSGAWEMQLHAGRGHHNIRYGRTAAASGPFYAYRARRERIGDWWRRVREDLEWGERELRTHVPGYDPISFAPPYGNYGQLSTNDRRIPARLDAWLERRFGLVFVQEPARYAAAGDGPVPRLQVTRKMTGGDIHAWLAAQLPN
jgi:peptidoglycan/xylan/chitin deacetylase (PgdA/CDA1 family)